MKERSVLAHSECILIVTIMLSNCSPFTGPTAAAYSEDDGVPHRIAEDDTVAEVPGGSYDIKLC
jgi:hypothetical protein